MSNAPEMIRQADSTLGDLSKLSLGQRFSIGATRITLEESLAFSRDFDPLSFHVDADRAEDTMFKGLIVSGLHTLSAIHALSIRGGFLREPAVVCSAGVDELRFHHPVRPGDVLSVTAEVIGLKPPRPPRDFGTARLRYAIANGEGLVVMTYIDNHVLRCSASASEAFTQISNPRL